MRVDLQPITVDNWKACIALSVAENQQGFVSSNLYSIAEAQFYPDAQPFAVYNEARQMVGFILYGRDVFSGKWKIFRMMIDATHQRKGYGRAAMERAIAAIASQPDGDKILICYQNPNQAARLLYRGLGFTEQSVDEHGKVTALLKLGD